jgi:hypothetical protein
VLKFIGDLGQDLATATIRMTKAPALLDLFSTQSIQISLPLFAAKLSKIDPMAVS